MIERARALLFVSLLVALSCGTEQMEISALPIGDAVLALDSEGFIAVEVTADAVVIRTEEGATQCETGVIIQKAWVVINSASDLKSADHRLGWTLDPNRTVYDVIVAYAQRINTEGFEIRYVVDSEEMIKAVSALDSIFSDCGIGRHLKSRIEIPPP